MTVYRDPPPAVTITAEQAVETLYRRHHLFPPVDQRWVVQTIEGAAEGRLDHPLAQSARMLMDFGFTRDALIGALVEMSTRGRLRPPQAMPSPPQDPIPESIAALPDPCEPVELRNPYLNSVVESSWDYPPGWVERSAAEKACRLARLFEMPEAERWSRRIVAAAPPEGFGTIVMLSPGYLAKKWGIGEPYGRGYPDLLNETVRLARSVYRAANKGFAATMLDLGNYRQFHLVGAAAQALRALDYGASTPFLAFPGQLGRRWRGSSIARVEWHTSYADETIAGGWKEFPLPTLAALFELVHEPFRLMSPGSLAIDCPGDSIDANWGFFMNTGVSLAFGHDNLHLIDRSRTRPDPVFGSATGLVRI